MIYFLGFFLIVVIGGLIGGKKVADKSWPMSDYVAFMMIVGACAGTWPLCLFVAIIAAAAFGFLKGCIWIMTPKK